jgi:2-succinyl-5-enolpyruvyl-6-hydroxy-3-cyclohexene-1-carboxylate synthase
VERNLYEDEKFQAISLNRSTVMKSNNILSENLSRLWSSLIIGELLNNDIDTFYVSPGMRNAPLIAAICNNENAKIKLGIDERAQAYRALGYSKATGKTSVLICTSGTALANYMPAIIEAKKTGIPLLVLSADRPIELATSDANQTIDQVKFYGEHVCGHLNLGAPTIEISPQALASSIDNLLFKSKYPTSGPVHMNCPFREPLDDTKQSIPENYLSESIQVLSRKKFTSYPLPDQSCNQDALIKIAKQLNSIKKGLLVIGSLPPSMNKGAIKEFIEKLGWPVFLDVSSSLKYSYSIKDNCIPTFDHSEVFDQYVLNRPEMILHIGGRTTSKHYYRYLETYKEVLHISVNLSSAKEDPSHQTLHRVVAAPDIFCHQMTSLLNVSAKQDSKPNWYEFINAKKDIIEKAPLTYPSLSKSLIEKIPNKSNLYIANSTVVRSFDNYISLEDKKDLNVYTNRGVSGIEGLVASACGVADISQEPTTLVIGDVSFLHDLNSLALLKEVNNQLIIVLVNNGGGGIFTLLPIAKDKTILPYMSTPHEHQFDYAAKLFEINYNKVFDIHSFNDSYQKAIESKSHQIIELIIDNDKNIEIFKKLKTVKVY